MTRARQNANISPAVGRNMVINGSMNVAARSSSVAGLGATAGSIGTNYGTRKRMTPTPKGDHNG